MKVALVVLYIWLHPYSGMVQHQVFPDMETCEQAKREVDLVVHAACLPKFKE